MTDAIRDALTAFSDFINEPPQYEDQRMVRDYRHELARKWIPLLEIIHATAPQALAATPAVATSASPCLNCCCPSDELFCGMCREMGCSIPSATPAVDGEPVAYRWKYEDEKSWTFAKKRPDHLYYGKDVICEPLYLAAQPASPLRRSQDVPYPVYKAVERILDENSAWIARPSDEVTKRIALAATVAAHSIIAASPPEQPATDPAFKWGLDYGKDLLKDINQLAHAAGTGALHRDVLQRAFREIKRLTTTEPRRSSGEPIREDNYMSNDLDKGSDA